MGFLGQHEARRARQRVEARLRQAFQLHLAVAIGEEGEHEERQPVRRLLVEGAEHARLVDIARAALQQALGLLAAVLAEIFVQQVDHGPEMAAFLDVDLEEVAHVVERRRGLAEMALLLDAGRLRVALHDDQSAQLRAMLARHVLPGFLTFGGAEVDAAILLLIGKEDAPAVLGHLDIIELGPALGVDRDGRAQVDVRGLETLGPHRHPPVDVAGMPLLERLRARGRRRRARRCWGFSWNNRRRRCRRMRRMGSVSRSWLAPIGTVGDWRLRPG